MSFLNRFLMVFLVGVALLAMSACNRSEVEQEVAGPSPVPELTPQQATPVLTAEATRAETTDIPLAGGEGSANTSIAIPDDFQGMLDSLGSYRMVVQAEFFGQDANGLSRSFAWQTVSTALADGSGYRLDLSVPEDQQVPGLVALSLVRLGDSAYLHVPAAGCIGGGLADFADDMELPLDPAVLLGALGNATPVASDVMVNGTRSMEYQFDQSAVTWPSIGALVVDGTAYVSQDSGLIHQVRMAVSGTGDLMGEGRVLVGEYQITIDVVDLDDGTGIELPDGCGDALPYPVADDAYQLAVIEDLVAYKSYLPVADVVTLYLSEMDSLGWRLVEEPEPFDDGTFMTYERDGVQILVTIDYDAAAESTSVLISP